MVSSHPPGHDLKAARGGAKALLSLGARASNQKGFTLIEMLVVISILGILAAVVTMSMIGVTSVAQKRALQGEQMEVQSALNFMIMDQRIDPGDACAHWQGSTNDMSLFPTSTAYTVPGSGHPVALYSPLRTYLHGRITRQKYTCTSNGSVEAQGP